MSNYLNINHCMKNITVITSIISTHSGFVTAPAALTLPAISAVSL